MKYDDGTSSIQKGPWINGGTLVECTHSKIKCVISNKQVQIFVPDCPLAITMPTSLACQLSDVLRGVMEATSVAQA